MPETGAALARLGGGPALNEVGAISANDAINIDFGQAGAIPDFSWITGGTSPAQGPSSSAGPAAAAPAGPAASNQGADGSWTEQDEQMLDRAISGPGGGSGASALGGSSLSGSTSGDAAKYDQIFSQFGQSQEGNCASIAVIKAALDKYKGKVFQEVKKNGDGYDIKMQDGKSVKLSKAELQQGAKAAKFKGQPSEVKSMAILMFAAMAKRGAEEGGGSMDRMLQDMNNGFDPKKSAQLLGLGQKVKEIDPNSAGQQDGAVGWNDQHAVYMDSGKTDSYGQARSADGTDTRGKRLTKAFVFT